MLQSVIDDLRTATRSLRRAPGFTLAAVVTLAAGVMGTVAMVALVRGVLLRPLPVRDQARLVLAWTDLPASGYVHDPFGGREIAALARDGSRVFEAVAGVDANGAGPVVVEEDGRTTTVDGALVAGAFFDVLGTTAVLGRTLTAADDVDGAEKVLVISHALWRQRYDASPGVVGRRLTANGERFTIVGVMPAGLDYPVGVQVWAPTHTVPTTGPFGDAAREEVDLVARLRPGATIDHARAELASRIAARERQAHPDAPRGYVPVVQRFEDAIAGSTRRPLAILLSAVLLVLVVACANVANLVLMRAEARRVELAVHVAIGAGRGRLVRQAIGECFLLSAAAVALGGPLGYAGLHALLRLAPGGLPRLDAIALDVPTAGAMLLLPIATTLLAALPAMTVIGGARALPAVALGCRVSAGASARRGRRALVVAQVAIAVGVVAAATVLGRSLIHLRSIDTGVAAESLVFVALTFPGPVAPSGASHGQRLERLMARLRALPGVAAVTPVNAVPFTGAGWDVPAFSVEGQDARAAAANPALGFEAIGPAHFATLGVPMRRGRAFTEHDRAGQPLVAIVSEEVARAWPGGDPVGQRLKIGGPASSEAWRTVVGVAASVRYRELARPVPTLYLPAAQFIDAAQRLAIRTNGDPAAVAAAVRGQIDRAEPGVAVLEVARFEDVLAQPLAAPRFQVAMAGLFAVVAGLLAAVGLFAALAASVRQRTREIAIRVAVGASPVRIRGLIGWEALWLAGTGAALGCAASLAGAPLLARVVTGVPPDDPIALALAVAAVLVAVGIAAWWPVRRATRVDAAATLRH